MAGQVPAFHRASDPAHLVSGQRHLVELFLSSFFINVVALALPLSMLQIYDRILPNHNMATLDLLALGVISALILEMLLRTLREGLAGLVSARFEHRGHYESLRRLLSLPMSRFEKDGGGLIWSVCHPWISCGISMADGCCWLWRICLLS